MDAHVVMTWSQARNDGHQTYFTGKPCARGHLAVRRVVSHACVECIRLAVNTGKKRRRALRRAALGLPLYERQVWPPLWLINLIQGIFKDLSRPERRRR